MSEKNNIYALIAAGGSGTRFGSAVPKQFTEVRGKELIEYSVDAFASCGAVDAVIAVVPAGFTEHTAWLFRERKNVFVTEGGEDRNGSLIRGIDRLRSLFDIDEETVLLVHDAARPGVDERAITASIKAMSSFDAVTVAMRSVDSVAVSPDGSEMTDAPDRKNIYMIQTPQTFRPLLYERLYEALDREGKEQLTESCSLFLRNGYKVGIVPGGQRYMKVTAPSDLGSVSSILK